MVTCKQCKKRRDYMKHCLVCGSDYCDTCIPNVVRVCRECGERMCFRCFKKHSCTGKGTGSTRGRPRKVQRSRRRPEVDINMEPKHLAILIVGIIGVMLLISSVYIVSAGERGVLLTFGKPSMDAKPEGIGLKIPIAQSIKIMEVRTQKIETTSDSASRDLQDVQTTIALNFHLKPDSVPRLYQEVGFGYKDRVIDPAIEESVKAITAKYTAAELITKRPQVRTDMQALIGEKLSQYHMKVDSFNIVNFQFSEEFDHAIEQKVTAEQLKQKAEMDLQRIEVEAKQAIAAAKGKAEALEIEGEALRKNPEIAEIRAIEKWDGVMPKVTGGAMPFIDVGNVD